MAKKFTDLALLNTLTSDDIFAIVNDEGNRVSKQITAETISKFVFSQSVVGTSTNTTNIITALQNRGRQVDSGTGSVTLVDNGVHAGKVFFDGPNGARYDTLKNLLVYTNIQGAPDGVTSNSNIENGQFYVSLDTILGVPKLVVKDIDIPAVEGQAQPVQQTQEITLDMIKEGAVNKYFNSDIVERELEDSFEGYFNKYSASFDGGNVKDSVLDIPAVLNEQQTNNEDKQASSMTVLGQDALFDREEPVIKNGDILRIYGASSTTGSTITQVPVIGAQGIAHSASFVTATGSDTVKVSFQYKLARYNLKTGEVGPRTATNAGTENLVSFKTGLPGETTTSILKAFNEDKFINLNISCDVGEGILVWRRNLGNSGEPFKLIAVLGPLDLESGSFKDYYTFDYTAWSGKNPDDNSYYEFDPANPSKRLLTHFPATLSSTSTAAQDAVKFRGWADVLVAGSPSVATGGGGGYVINFQPTVYINGSTNFQFGNDCVFAQNDTVTIQNAIQQKTNIGTKSLAINAKTYNVSNISIPDEFGLVGVTGISEIKKLPWSGYRDLVGVNQDASILRAQSSDSSINISLLGLKFNGNLLNQYLLGSSTGNYFINFGINPVALTIDNCRFNQMSGAGILASSPVDLKITNCEVADSSTTDRHEEFPPLTIDDGNNTMVTNNVFKNFTASIDASVTKEGSVIANNVVKNCGQGLTIFGSTYIVSSPNVLVGPANEFLSSPDILNSEYDSVNINRSQMILMSSEPGGKYISDPMVYQENGAAFDLTQSSSGSGQIVYRSRLIRGYNNDGGTIDTPTETPYGEFIGPGQRDINGTNTVRYVDENAKTLEEQSSNLVQNQFYQIEEVGDVDWTKCGASHNAADVVFQYNGNKLQTKDNGTGTRNTIHTTGGARVPTSGYVTAKEFQGYRDGANVYGPIVIENYINPDLVSSNGEFQFQIRNSDHNTLSNLVGENGKYSRGELTTLYNQKKLVSAVDTDATKLHPFNTYHVGVAWTASYKYRVKAGQLSSVGAWGTPRFYDANGLSTGDTVTLGNNIAGNTNPDLANAHRRYIDLTIDVDDLKFVDVGDFVTISDQNDDLSIGANVNGNGMIVKKTATTATTTQLVIRFFGTKYADNGTGDDAPSGQVIGNGQGTKGIINIEDDFVMAQGLIK